MVIIESGSPEDTFSAGEEMGRKVTGGTVVALNGDLGAGKTVFTKGFAKGLGIEEDVNSPTFNILKTYSGGRLVLHHFDVYRIGDPSEMDEIGYEDCFFGDGVSLVEWADILPEIMPPETVYIRIEKEPARGFSYRRIEIEQAGSDER